MRRREFIAGLWSAAAWPVVVRAQQSGTRRVGMLMPFSENDPVWQANLKVFLAELQKLGWAEGRNVRFDHRWAGADPERMRADAAELISLEPAVIVTFSNQSASILGRQTRTIPIVFQAADGTGDWVPRRLVR